MAMALSLARFDRDRLTVASAGMPPVLVHRGGRVEEIALGATPLGTLGVEYEQCEVELRSGDTVLLLSDGFPELMNESGQQLGYAAALDVFAIAASAPTATDVIGSLAEEARRWHGDTPPNDDVTFVVVRVS
jgi:serine phosphatase RsbU (regulator of sigma subunit)